MEDKFVAFADWCDATVTCALHGLGTKKAYADLKKRARAGTVIDPSTRRPADRPLDFYYLSLTTFQTYLPQLWSQVAPRMRTLYDGSATPAARSGELVNRLKVNRAATRDDRQHPRLGNPDHVQPHGRPGRAVRT